MTRDDFIQQYWSYYTMLERNCKEISRYVDFRTSNYNTCSNEIIGQLLDVGAEFDNFCKTVCSIENEERPNITDYANWMLDNIRGIRNVRIKVSGSDLEIMPFKNWNRNKAGDLYWWQAYNNVKHNRIESYAEGNLKNLLSALAALYFLEMYLVKRIAKESGKPNALDVPPNSSFMFRIEGWKTAFSVIGHNYYTDYDPNI